MVRNIKVNSRNHSPNLLLFLKIKQDKPPIAKINNIPMYLT